MFRHLEGAGFRIQVQKEVLQVWLPPRASRGLRVFIGGDPFVVFLFETSDAAHDYANSRRLLPRDRLRSFFPDDPPSDLARHALSRGPFVLESDPEAQFWDEASIRPLPEDAIRWSPLLEGLPFHDAVETLSVGPVDSVETSFSDLFEGLMQSGYRVELVKPMVSHWLQPEAINGFSATIAGDDFLVYQFPDTQTTERYCALHRHNTVQAGSFALRSNPAGQYKIASEEAMDRTPNEIAWSPLLKEYRFIAALRGAARR
ncbi:MAG: hypothetical protein HY646_22200 [Acidobacteria bacterium]|nr:hypothetical protein [Acidobacteriota bacterium]